MSKEITNQQYATLFSRRNPFFQRHVKIWEKSLDAYRGGSRYIKHALVKHISEIDIEFQERLLRAYYFNYPKHIAKIITQYVLAKRPERTDINDDIAEDFSRTGLRVDEVMRQFSTYLNICGVAWIMVDMPSFEGIKTKEQEINERLRPYAIALSPLDVLDWDYGDDMQLNWVLIKEYSFDNSNPLEEATKVEVRKLWTRFDCTIIKHNSSTGSYEHVNFEHNLGVVPLIQYIDTDGYGMDGGHFFEDVVRISDAILNNESEAQMNTVKQMFSMLVLPEDFISSATEYKEKKASESSTEDTTKLSHIIARSVAIWESAENKGISRYIAPTGADTNSIRSENQNLRKSLYEVVGLAVANNTKLVESAEAKAWDFQGVEQYLATRADILEQCEFRAWQLMSKWLPSIQEPTIQYNRNFSMLDLQISVSTLLELSTFNQDNEVYQKEIGKTAVQCLNRLRQLPQDKQEEIIKEIDNSDLSDWSNEPDLKVDEKNSR